MARTRTFRFVSLILCALALELACPASARAAAGQYETRPLETEAASESKAPAPDRVAKDAPTSPCNRPGAAAIPRPENLTGSAPAPVSAAAIDLRAYFDELGPDAALWYQHVQTLANAVFEGRAPGTRGGELTEQYLEFYFRSYGLTPAFAGRGGEESSYRQPLSVEGAPREGFATDGSLSIAGRELAAGTDFVVTANSANAEVMAPLTFVGYGIEKGEDGYTSFGRAADLSGRVALLLRLEPLDEEGHARWGEQPGAHSSLGPKLKAIAERGAAGILLANPPGAQYPLEALDALPPSVGFGCSALTRIPTAMITREAADHLLATADPKARDLLAWRRLADEGTVTTVDLDNGVYVTLRADIQRRGLSTANVAGILPGQGDLKDQWIVVGGHHDHVGYGLGGAVHPDHNGDLHAGADDNASGVGAVLVLAKRLAREYADARDGADLRSILFIGFAGEETGLNGSRHFVENPPVPLDRIYMMLNLDMVGRLRQDTLWLQGAGTAVEFSTVIGPLLARSNLNVVNEPHVAGSDQVSFVNAGVPALFAMTGGHDELHTPLDQARTLDPRGAIRVVNLMQQILLELAAHPQALSFVPQETGGPASCSGPTPAGAKPEPPSSGCGGKGAK
jgi:Zn-dependent M28 family amino/carboxypeptidase